MKKITPNEFTTIARYIYDISGIYLDQTKAYLIETRLKGILKEIGADSYQELYHRAKSDITRALEMKIINAISTQETMFFRDNSPFEIIRTMILPELVERKMSQPSLFPANIRIWSAACSTGQETYSIAIVLKELLSNPSKFNIRLLGTDISESAIACASCGEYNQLAVERGLPKDKLDKYFTQNGLKWKVKDDISAMCAFKRHNLMDSFSSLGRFDIVLCRNVAIYFAQEDKVRLFNKLADILEPGGYLIVGSSESVTGITSRFEARMNLKMIFYQLINQNKK
ncbi:protein-glutamate O-methyltransferase CheR [Desulfococcaceae bacterium HSG8]|nr:protein-glutamate O-methyltransferase CheR [Desulfococcaceae bacterium HSG8]